MADTSRGKDLSFSNMSTDTWDEVFTSNTPHTRRTLEPQPSPKWTAVRVFSQISLKGYGYHPKNELNNLEGSQIALCGILNQIGGIT